MSSGDITVSSTDCTGYTFHAVSGADQVLSTIGEVAGFYATGTASASSCHFKAVSSATLANDMAITTRDVPTGGAIDTSNGNTSTAALDPTVATGSVSTGNANDLLYGGLLAYAYSHLTWSGGLADTTRSRLTTGRITPPTS